MNRGWSLIVGVGTISTLAYAAPVDDLRSGVNFAMQNLDSPYTITSTVLGNSSGIVAQTDWELLNKPAGSLTGTQSLNVLASAIPLTDTAFLTGTATGPETITFAVSCPTAIGKTVTVQVDATTTVSLRLTAVSGSLFAKLNNIPVTEDPVAAGVGRNVFFTNNSAQTSFIEVRGNVAGIFPSIYRIQPANFRGYGGSGVLPPKLTITVQLPGFIPGPTGLPAVVTLSNGQIFNVVLDANGTASVRPNAPGTYAATVKVGTFLSSQHAAINLTTSDQARTFACVNGDIDDDDSVSILDYLALSSAYETTSTSTSWNPRADLDGDGEVSILDYITLSSNYDRSGPTPN